MNGASLAYPDAVVAIDTGDYGSMTRGIILDSTVLQKMYVQSPLG